MSKQKIYKQCHLEKNVQGNVVKTTSWLPEKFAVVGKPVGLKDSIGNWDEGWTVSSVGASKNAEQIERQHRQHKNHRKATDI